MSDYTEVHLRPSVFRRASVVVMTNREKGLGEAERNLMKAGEFKLDGHPFRQNIEKTL